MRETEKDTQKKAAGKMFRNREKTERKADTVREETWKTRTEGEREGQLGIER